MANAADNFNRANGDMNGSTASDGIHTWTTRNGSWAISSNQADPAGGSAEQITLNPGCSDCDVGATLNVISGANEIGVLGRWSDTSNYIHAVITTTAIRLRKRQAGTTSSIATASITGSNGDKIRLHMVGDQLSVYHTPIGTGVEVLAISAQTESLNQTQTNHGMIGNAATAMKFDDFFVTDLSGGGGSGNALLAIHMQMAS